MQNAADVPMGTLRVILQEEGVRQWTRSQNVPIGTLAIDRELGFGSGLLAIVGACDARGDCVPLLSARRVYRRFGGLRGAVHATY